MMKKSPVFFLLVLAIVMFNVPHRAWAGQGSKESSKHEWSPKWQHRGHVHKSVLEGITGDFHYWLGCLMAVRGILDLSPEQSQKLDETLTDHTKYLIEEEAAELSETMQLKYDLRQSKVDMSLAQAQLKKITDHESAIQLSAIKTYESILDIMTPPQRKKIDELIGTAFPSVWHPIRPWAPWMKGEEEHKWESQKHEKNED